MLRVDEQTYELLYKHYREYTWERGALNTNMLRGKQWSTGAVLNFGVTAAGPWAAVFTNTPASTMRLAQTVVQEWEQRYTVSAAFQVGLNELNSSRPTLGDLQQLSLLACAFEHWLRPLAKQEFGEGCADALERIWKQSRDELNPVLAARATPEMFGVMTLRTLRPGETLATTQCASAGPPSSLWRTSSNGGDSSSSSTGRGSYRASSSSSGSSGSDAPEPQLQLPEPRPQPHRQWPRQAQNHGQWRRQQVYTAVVTAVVGTAAFIQPHADPPRKRLRIMCS